MTRERGSPREPTVGGGFEPLLTDFVPWVRDQAERHGAFMRGDDLLWIVHESSGQPIVGLPGREPDAHELTVGDALDLGLLSPFQYFGVHDETDLSTVDFRAGRYRVAWFTSTARGAP